MDDRIRHLCTRLANAWRDHPVNLRTRCSWYSHHVRKLRRNATDLAPADSIDLAAISGFNLSSTLDSIALTYLDDQAQELPQRNSSNATAIIDVHGTPFFLRRVVTDLMKLHSALRSRLVSHDCSNGRREPDAILER